MSVEDLRKEALEEWDKYGEAIKEAFGFPKDSKILIEESMKTVLETQDEDFIRKKMLFIRDRIYYLKKGLEETRRLAQRYI